MEYDVDTLINRIGSMDPGIADDALRSLAEEFGKEKVAEHIARSIDRNIVIVPSEIEKFVSGRLSNITDDDIAGLAKDYGMDTPEGRKEIASQLITEDVVDCFADLLVDLVSIGRDEDVKKCILSITKAIRKTQCPLTVAAGDYTETYPEYLEKCLSENDPLKAFIQEEK